MERLPGSVLFCCSLNSIRSPMAEALLKRLHGSRIFVDSVGLIGEPLNVFTAEVMDEIGIDVRRHRPKSFDQVEGESFDLIITLSPEAHHHALEMTRTASCEIEYWPTLDPTLVDGSRQARLDAFRSVRDSLNRRIIERFPPVASPQP